MSLMATSSDRKRPKMWEYQSHFRASATTAAQEVFGRLDENLRPEIVLLGIDVDSGEITVAGGPEVISESTDTVEVGDELRLRLQKAEFGELQKPLTRLDAHELRDSPIFEARNLFVEHLERNTPDHERAWYLSVPVRIGTYVISAAIGLDREIVIGYSGIGESDAPSYDITHSLLNAVIFEFLNTCHAVLLEPDPGSRLTLYSREHTELIRGAANQLMFKLTYRTRQWGYPVSLFDACNAISALSYEGEPGIGTMVVAQRERVNVDVVVELLTRVGLTDHRGTRKLLEMATEQMCLLSDAGYIYGLGRCSQQEGEVNGMVRIDFTGHYAWEVSCNGRSLMRVINGHPQLPGKPINETKFRKEIAETFVGIATQEVDHLWEIALEASRQQHGTMIVVSTGARFEAERLGSQCIRTRPMTPSRDVVRTITSIDGAVLLSPDGTCHAIGVILDGLSTTDGNPMRGSRYNSAVRYVETSRRQFGYGAYAIVVSEDGMVDLIAQTGDWRGAETPKQPVEQPESPEEKEDERSGSVDADMAVQVSEELLTLRRLACAERIEHPVVHRSLRRLELLRDHLDPDAIAELRRIGRLFGPGLGEEMMAQIEGAVRREQNQSR